MKAEKGPYSLPRDLLADTRCFLPDGNPAACVADGLRCRILSHRQARYLAGLDQEFGPLSEEEIEEARQLWHSCYHS